MNNCEIILGHKAFFNRTVFQACAAQTYTYREARSTIQSMKIKFKNCTWAGIAFRITNMDDSYEEIPGMGKKILTVMTRMDITHLTIGVGVWYSGSIAHHDCNRMVLDRVIDIINLINSIIPPEMREKTPIKEYFLIEPEPISDHNYLYFPTHPYPAPLPPYDYRTENLRKHLKEIMIIIDENEAKSLHELVGHSIIGKILQILFCLLNTTNYTIDKAKEFFKNQNVVGLMNDFEPYRMKKKKIREAKNLLKHFAYLDVKKLDKICHSSVLILDFVSTVIEILEDVEMPSPIEKPETNHGELSFRGSIKPIIYRNIPRKGLKYGKFIGIKEMIVNDSEVISPTKIAMSYRNTSDVDLSLLQVGRIPQQMSMIRYSSVEPKFLNHSNKKRHYKSVNFQNLTLATSGKTLEHSKKTLNMSTKAIEFNKNSPIASETSFFTNHKSNHPSKNTLQKSKKDIISDEDIIDKVLKIKTQQNDSFSQLDTSAYDVEIIKNIRKADISKQPTQFLLKFASILREKRENHSLL
ncbi:hypothetical protein SteCoe_35805 [Stentor coeruleus]|uniref:Uncharacterized protein n=1 Tax=Stentor coeruleus TaxID=5963 RepID=A0A1R2ARF7_9CILI|nr:hypothetical protein SteCoe_35805 [Stentor coeruleus]